MEPAATSFPGEKDPPQPLTKAAHLSEGQGPAQGGWARWAFPTILILLAIAFGWGLCQGYDLVFVLSTFYLAVWCFCLWMLQLDRRDHGGDPAAAARERQRFRLAAWAISLAWSSMAAILVVKAASVLALRVFLWVFAGLAMVLAFYLIVAVRRSDSHTDDDGRWPEKGLDELSPEQRV